MMELSTDTEPARNSKPVILSAAASTHWTPVRDIMSVTQVSGLSRGKRRFSAVCRFLPWVKNNNLNMTTSNARADGWMRQQDGAGAEMRDTGNSSGTNGCRGTLVPGCHFGGGKYLRHMAVIVEFGFRKASYITPNVTT